MAEQQTPEEQFPFAKKVTEAMKERGITDRQETKVTCPQCGKESTFEMWTSINTVLHPEMKQAVRDRSAFVFKCPECGTETPVDYGFLYQQPDEKIMIQYVTDDAQAEKVHKMLADPTDRKVLEVKNSGYIIRLVRTANQLADKLAIFDAELDDRIVEVYKLSALVTMRREHPEFDLVKGEFIFYTDENGEHRLQIMNDGEPFGSISFNMSAYHAMENDFIGILCDIQHDDPVVNRQTAIDLMKILGDN